MDRKTRGTLAVLLLAVAIVVAGVANHYSVGQTGDTSDDTERQSAAPTAQPDAEESEDTTPTPEPETAEPEPARPEDTVRFTVIVNEAQELELLVPVSVADGLTREEAELIVEATFIQVKGETVMRRLDSLTLDENSIEAHYTWGLDESDMGHFFDIIVDITSRLITVAHCF